MNGDGPLISLDPSAESVSYAPVLHGVELGHKSEAEQDMALDEPRGGSRRTLPSCQN
jgi:hypothetical protein